MTNAQAPQCPSCGAEVSGANFCPTCGVSLGTRRCASCGADTPAGARFCALCGAATAGGRASFRAAWLYGSGAAAILAVILAMLVYQAPRPQGSEALASTVAPTSAGAPPDISSLSPRERFDRLYNRIMRAAEAGDEATVSQFTPMALMAYGQLPEIDADARYHAALLKAHTGDAEGARLLADTILTQTPGHLFGYMVRGTVARWQKDDKALTAAYQGFLQHDDAEQRAERPEYTDHSSALADFRKAAGATRGK